MRWAVFALGLVLWVAAWPWLTQISRQTPPTHCQLLLYYWLLRCAMNGHRDNSSSSDIEKMAEGLGIGTEGHASAGAVNSQRVGSNVLVFTTGTAPMVFTLAFAHADDILENREEYVVHPRYQMELCGGTLSILDPVDDLVFTHGAKFSGNFRISAVDGDRSWWRKGWTFRWLQAPEDFYEDTRGLRLSAARVTKHGDHPRSDVVWPREA